MAELVANRPRCRAASITFDVTALAPSGVKYDWQHFFEACDLQVLREVDDICPCAAALPG
jgi:hypothetical protein